MNLQEIIKEVATELGLSSEVVNKAYSSYWEFVKKTIKNLPIKEELTEEQFSQLRTSFNVPVLGKLYCDYSRILGIKHSYKKYIKTQEDVSSKKD